MQRCSCCANSVSLTAPMPGMRIQFVSKAVHFLEARMSVQWRSCGILQALTVVAAVMDPLGCRVRMTRERTRVILGRREPVFRPRK